jgi:hypothetical protein
MKNASPSGPPAETATDKRDFLDWLISGRHRVQLQLRIILRLMERHDIAKSAPDHLQTIASLLHGTAFSLWRSVFLARKNRDRETSLKQMEQYIEKTLTTNIITFGDDSTLFEWAFAYYLNNAHLRLRLLLQMMNGLKEEIGTTTMEYIDLPLARTDSSDTLTIWDAHCYSLERAVALFEKKLLLVATTR